jgi:flagellar motor switch protein FliM
MTEDERLAAEWASSMEASDAPVDGDDDMAAAMGMADVAPARILNQDEIDSLLGFDSGGGDKNVSGIAAILNNSAVSYDRLPMLDVVFDRLGRLLSTSLRNLTSDNVEASIDDIHSVRFEEYLNSIPLPAMIAIMKAEEWDNLGLITLDSALIYSIVDVLLGGRKGASVRIEGRPYTTIECNLVERMLQVVMNDLSSAFDPLSPVTFRFERLETNPRFAAITQKQNACVLIKVRVDMDERGGMMEILIPYATLEPIRELLLQMFMGEKFGRDSIWETHLSNELHRTDMPMHAVLSEMTLSLKEVMNWRVGSCVMLDHKPDELVQLRCGARTLFRGRMGRKDQNIAIKIEEDILVPRAED